jgi:soluble lytic murein transglycosylase-like protein
MQESHDRPGAVGQQTQYGRAVGSMQLLPSTAQEMARNLGLPWQPQLMTGTTPEAADYQRRLGEAYLQEGLRKTGNPRDALRYYHGGPNRALWGPKTNAYASSILERLR